MVGLSVKMSALSVKYFQMSVYSFRYTEYDMDSHLHMQLLLQLAVGKECVLAVPLHLRERDFTVPTRRVACITRVRVHIVMMSECFILYHE